MTVFVRMNEAVRISNGNFHSVERRGSKFERRASFSWTTDFILMNGAFRISNDAFLNSNEALHSIGRRNPEFERREPAEARPFVGESSISSTASSQTCCDTDSVLPSGSLNQAILSP